MKCVYWMEDTKRWRVRVRRRGFKSISMNFKKLEDAEKFANIILQKLDDRKQMAKRANKIIIIERKRKS